MRSVEARPFGYTLVSALSRFLLRLFYPRIDIVGAEHIPAAAPLVLAANHHNSLVDAMLLVAVVPRRLRTLANAPLFRNPLIGPFLRMMGALPVHRVKESGNDPSRNAALFAETTSTLRARGAIMLFPEGRTQPEPQLLELRTGAARMLLAAQADEADPVVLLPVGLVFRNPGIFREGSAVVHVGRPVETADCVALARSEPEVAARRLTERLGSSLRRLIVEAGDRATLGLLTFVEEIWAHEKGETPADGGARLLWLQGVMRIYRRLEEKQPERVGEIREQLRLFERELEAGEIEPAQLDEPASHHSFGVFALRRGVALLLVAPLALVGIAIHTLPYKFTGAVVKRILRDDEEEATDKLAVAFVFFPVLWTLEGILVHQLGGSWATLLFALALFPLGLLAIWWRERLEHVVREGRAFVRERNNPDLVRSFRERRRALLKELSDLAKLVPEVD